MFYRLVDNTPEGPVKVYVQYNKVLGEYHNAIYYRHQLLNDFDAYIQISRIKNIAKSLILMEDMS